MPSRLTDGSEFINFGTSGLGGSADRLLPVLPGVTTATANPQGTWKPDWVRPKTVYAPPSGPNVTYNGRRIYTYAERGLFYNGRKLGVLTATVGPADPSPYLTPPSAAYVEGMDMGQSW